MISDAAVPAGRCAGLMIACVAQWTNPVLFAVKTFDDEALYVTRMQTADGAAARRAYNNNEDAAREVCPSRPSIPNKRRIS
jgi:hypothetical protein